MYSGTIPLDHDLWPDSVKVEMAIRRHHRLTKAIHRDVTRQTSRFRCGPFTAYMEWLASGRVDPAGFFVRR